jgi:hypothetical protein
VFFVGGKITKHAGMCTSLPRRDSDAGLNLMMKGVMPRAKKAKNVEVFF